MGCGTSKAAQVAETEITTEPKPVTPPTLPPPSAEPNASQSTTGTKLQSETSGPPISSDAGQCLPSHSSTSSSTTATSPTRKEFSHIVKVQSSPTRDSVTSNKIIPHSTSGEHSAMESTTLEREDQAVAGVGTESATGSERYAVFEFDMGHRGSTDPIAPPPKRLEKLEGATKVTAQALAEKQREVQGRKEKELEKRAHTRLSRKERLRREIMEARELEAKESEETQPNDDHYGNDLIDAPVEIEVDETYNVDAPMLDDWAKDEHTLSTSREVMPTSDGTSAPNDKSDNIFSTWESTVSHGSQ